MSLRSPDDIALAKKVLKLVALEIKNKTEQFFLGRKFVTLVYLKVSIWMTKLKPVADQDPVNGTKSGKIKVNRNLTLKTLKAMNCVRLNRNINIVREKLIRSEICFHRSYIADFSQRCKKSVNEKD